MKYAIIPGTVELKSPQSSPGIFVADALAFIRVVMTVNLDPSV